jgi:uncharacterized membrane protein
LNATDLRFGLSWLAGPFPPAIMVFMQDSAAANRSARARIPVRPVFGVLAGGIILAWLVNTPPGLLGKADAIGYAVCHQIDLRSFHLGVRSLPLCARCSGMYLGAALTFVYYIVRGRGRAGLMPTKPLIAILVLFFMAWAIDGSNSYLHFFPGVKGLYEPNNTLRLITGSLLGILMTTVVYAGFNQTVWREWKPQPALRSFGDLGILVGLMAVLDGIVLSENPLILYPLALTSAFSVVFMLTSIYTMIGLLLSRRENRAESWRGVITPALAGIVMAFVQIGLADIVRLWLTGTWGGLQL